MTVVVDGARPRSQTAHSGVTALNTNTSPVAARYEQTTFSTRNTSSTSFKTRGNQEVLSQGEARDKMKEGLTI